MYYVDQNIIMLIWCQLSFLAHRLGERPRNALADISSPKCSIIKIHSNCTKLEKSFLHFLLQNLKCHDKVPPSKNYKNNYNSLLYASCCHHSVGMILSWSASWRRHQWWDNSLWECRQMLTSKVRWTRKKGALGFYCSILPQKQAATNIDQVSMEYRSQPTQISTVCLFFLNN